MKQRKIEWSGWTLIGIVIVSGMMIGMSLITSALYLTPEQEAQVKMQELADDYYTEYLYPQLLGSLDADPKEALERYAETGIPTTYLRQLLHYGDGSHAKYEVYFTPVGCDTNVTGVKYFPLEPYGPNDYQTTFYWQCSKGEFPDTQ